MASRKTLEQQAISAQRVEHRRREVFNSREPVVLRKSGLMLPQRGDLLFMRLLDQIYDQPNVVAIDLHVNGRSLLEVRQLNKSMERRVRGLFPRSGDTEVMDVHIRIVAVIG
jgi:hypothetical protein